MPIKPLSKQTTHSMMPCNAPMFFRSIQNRMKIPANKLRTLNWTSKVIHMIPSLSPQHCIWASINSCCLRHKGIIHTNSKMNNLPMIKQHIHLYKTPPKEPNSSRETYYFNSMRIIKTTFLNKLICFNPTNTSFRRVIIFNNCLKRAPKFRRGRSLDIPIHNPNRHKIIKLKRTETLMLLTIDITII